MMIYRHFILEVVRFGTIQEARNKSISGHMSTDGSKSTGGLVLGFLDSASPYFLKGPYMERALDHMTAAKSRDLASPGTGHLCV